MLFRSLAVEDHVRHAVVGGGVVGVVAAFFIVVVVEELIPEMSQGQHSNVGTVFFAVGFSVMMVLDVALG